MTFLITAHSTKPGKEDIYEEFLQHRKLWFVRNLPGIISYKVFRTRKRFDPGGAASKNLNYTVMAIIEHEGDEQALTDLYTSEKWITFMEEYLHVLENDAPLYIADEIPEISRLSFDEFKEKSCSCP
ncbi:MAG TPA: hypothetical protein ENK61_02715 [Devosia sp.]|nr:hypothetical protein [Devosia sp.]